MPTQKSNRSIPHSNSPQALLQRYGLKAKKSWSQSFLHDVRIVEQIAQAAELDPNDPVVEIGAGLGILTRALANRASRVYAIEKDRDLAEVLRNEFRDLPHVVIIEQNALHFDFGQFSARIRVVGNLPYHMASPILFYLFANRRHIRSATVMLQKEMVERLLAPPGNRTYGVPSVLCHQVAIGRFCFSVGPGAFVPRPKVDSAVLHLQLREKPLFDVDEAALEQVVHAAFRYRRKTLRRALASHFSLEIAHDILAQSGIDGQRRGETLGLEEFAALARVADRHGS